MMTRRNLGATFTDLVIALVLVTLLIPGIATVMVHSRETANRVKCGSNLKQIGTAMMMYANENQTKYPRTKYDPDKAVTWGTGVSAANPFTSPDCPADNDVTAALFLLMRTQDIGPEVFNCVVQNPDLAPVRDDFGGRHRTALSQSNFSNYATMLSYSLASPYPGRAAEKAGYRFDSSLTSEFALMADLNPGVTGDYDPTSITPYSPAVEKYRGNSMNHSGRGQNVLYGDGHVEFSQEPFVGMQKDNIYTVSEGAGEITSKIVVGSPGWAGDSVLLPVAVPGAFKGHVMARRIGWLTGAGVAVALAVLVVILGIRSHRRRVDLQLAARGANFIPPPSA